MNLSNAMMYVMKRLQAGDVLNYMTGQFNGVKELRRVGIMTMLGLRDRGLVTITKSVTKKNGIIPVMHMTCELTEDGKRWQ